MSAQTVNIYFFIFIFTFQKSRKENFNDKGFKVHFTVNAAFVFKGFFFT